MGPEDQETHEVSQNHRRRRKTHLFNTKLFIFAFFVIYWKVLLPQASKRYSWDNHRYNSDVM